MTFHRNYIIYIYIYTHYYHVSGVDHLDCEPHYLTFKSGSVTASLNILLVNDDVPECNEEFEAHIVIENGGNSLIGPGFRLGGQSSTTITVVDEGIVIRIYYCKKVFTFP